MHTSIGLLAMLALLGGLMVAPSFPPQPPPVNPPASPPIKPPVDPPLSPPVIPPVGRPGERAQPPGPVDFTVDRIERSHGKPSWDATEAITVDMTIELRGRRLFEGVLTWDHRNDRVRMEGANEEDPLMIFDGSKAWISGEADSDPPAFAQLRLWPLILGAPFQMRAEGARLEPYRSNNLRDTGRTPFRVHFAGMADDDWCLGYVEIRTGRLDQLTFRSGLKLSAAKDDGGNQNDDGQADNASPTEPAPLAVVFDQFPESRGGGATIAREWRFYEWNEQSGIKGEPIGRVTIASPRFINEPDAAWFEKAEGMVESTRVRE